jgi:hypothetical protein
MPAAVILTLMLAQAPPAAESAEVARLERIRRELAEAPAITVLPATRAEGPVFRVTVQARKPLPPLWDNWSAVPTNIRPWFRSYHHEFLEQVTPEYFRSATLYPIGFVNTQMIEFLVKKIKALNRKMGEAAARREVQQALEEFRACRTDPDRPGCS